MPFTSDQLTRGADYAIETFQKGAPIDQVSYGHIALDWLLKNKKPSAFTNGAFKESVYRQHSANYQNYFGPDQVTYNERDPNLWTEFAHYNFHDGFYYDEDTLLQAGIVISDDSDAMPTAQEKDVLIDRLQSSVIALDRGIHENLAFEMYRDGSQSTKACPGFESVIDPTPAVGTVGGLNSATYTWWRNTANLTFAAADIITEMQESWDACIRYGGKRPSKIVCGLAYRNAYRAACATAIERHLVVAGKGAASMDGSIDALNFQGVPVEWDPTLEALDTLLSSTTRTKTCYFLHDDHITLRPVKGAWMQKRKPKRLPDRYVHYFGKTSKYSLTSNKRNALAVLSIS